MRRKENTQTKHMDKDYGYMYTKCKLNAVNISSNTYMLYLLLSVIKNI